MQDVLEKKGGVVQRSGKRAVYFHEDFYRVYTSDPAAAAGRMEAWQRDQYLAQVRETLERSSVDVIGVSAGFDNHIRDWGGLLTTEDYHQMGTMVRLASERRGCGCFGVLEGGYNYDVLGRNVLGFVEGLFGSDWLGATRS